MSRLRRVFELVQGDFARLLALAVLVRLLLLPLTHPWDTQTWLNVLTELSQEPNPLLAIQRPYETMRELSLLTQAGGRHGDFYEYWAYPPLMLYVYWPLAHLYTQLGGSLQTNFAAQPALIAPSFSLLPLLMLRAPILVAEVAVLFIMRALGVSIGWLWAYALNPLVLLVGIWTFDSVMVAFLLLGLLFATRQQWALAGAALGLGAATKFVPLVVLPAVIVGILWLQRPIMDRVRLAFVSVVAATLVVAVLVWPVADGVLYSLGFHAERFGTGLSVQQLWPSLAVQQPPVDWQPGWQAYASIEIGALLLPLALLVGTSIVVRRGLTAELGFLVLVLAFLIGAKVVNEPYALSALAVATVAVARYGSPGLRACWMLLWVLPFAYAMLNTPVWGFLFSPLQQLAPSLETPIGSWLDAYRVFRATPLANIPYAVLGVAFSAVAIWAVWVSSHAKRRLAAA